MAHGCEPVRAVERKHDRKRLVRSVLPRTQPRHRRVVRRIAHEVVSAHALHRDDRARLQAGDRQRQRVASPVRPARLAERENRPASRTRKRLGVEAAVGGVLVLAPAFRAEPEAGHARQRPVVGKRRNDGVARPALRAVGEGVSVASRGRVAQLGETVVAAEQVRRQMIVRNAASLALDDRESAEALLRHGARLRQTRPGKRRRLRDQRGFETRERCLQALGMDFDPAGPVPHPARGARAKPPGEGRKA